MATEMALGLEPIDIFVAMAAANAAMRLKQEETWRRRIPGEEEIEASIPLGATPTVYQAEVGAIAYGAFELIERGIPKGMALTIFSDNQACLRADGAGTLLVALSFPFIWTPCIDCSGWSDLAKTAYYAVFVVIFQIGWATVQIAHLSIIPALTTLKADRTLLNSYRYAATVVSNVVMYGVTIALITTDAGETQDTVAPTDKTAFRNASLIALGVGAIFTGIFQFTTPESKHYAENPFALPKEEKLGIEEEKYQAWGAIKSWFTTPQFYIVGIIYVATRLLSNGGQNFQGLYLQTYLGKPKYYIGIIPMIGYIGGFLSSFAMTSLNHRFGRKSIPEWLLIFHAIVFGVASSVMMVTSLSFVADLIATHMQSGGFVYGFMSFVDKLAVGTLVVLIQELAIPETVEHSTDADKAPESDRAVYRYIFTWITIIPPVFSLFMMILLRCFKIRNSVVTFEVASEDEPIAMKTVSMPHSATQAAFQSAMDIPERLELETIIAEEEEDDLNATPENTPNGGALEGENTPNGEAPEGEYQKLTNNDRRRRRSWESKKDAVKRMRRGREDKGIQNVSETF
ncbi:unnamed protein product [Cyprideis torosa]|uniref:Uncharacterized protein n=1 Tax=Cyprideis torosa TaxID=163714 RepID=A0A7R8ZN15_9CRUS|nr:unnamed protein product [Cyprideis torosa]CAG0886824.1 unnamed protein product [Cyprideis torosa]